MHVSTSGGGGIGGIVTGLGNYHRLQSPQSLQQLTPSSTTSRASSVVTGMNVAAGGGGGTTRQPQANKDNDR